MLNDELILVRLVNTYEALTIRQIGRRFHLSENSYTGYSKKLADYAKPDDQLLDERWIPHPTSARGGAIKVYIVGKRGRALLKSHGIHSEVKRARFQRNTSISKHNWHAFWVNDVLLGAQIWADRTEGVEVAAQMTDFDFDRDTRFPYPIKWGDGSEHGTKMDGLLAFAFEDEDKYDKQFLVELETGSHEEVPLREKVKNLALFIHSGGFQRAFGSDLFNGFLFFAMGIYGNYGTAEMHRKVVLKETAIQLSEMGLQDYAPFFRATSCPPDSQNLFIDPVWYFPACGPCNYDDYRLFVDVG